MSPNEIIEVRADEVRDGDEVLTQAEHPQRWEVVDTVINHRQWFEGRSAKGPMFAEPVSAVLIVRRPVLSEPGEGEGERGDRSTVLWAARMHADTLERAKMTTTAAGVLAAVDRFALAPGSERVEGPTPADLTGDATGPAPLNRVTPHSGASVSSGEPGGEAALARRLLAAAEADPTIGPSGIVVIRELVDRIDRLAPSAEPGGEGLSFEQVAEIRETWRAKVAARDVALRQIINLDPHGEAAMVARAAWMPHPEEGVPASAEPGEGAEAATDKATAKDALQYREALALLDGFVGHEDRPCVFDRHGNCEEHDWTIAPGEECGIPAARRLVARGASGRLAPEEAKDVSDPYPLKNQKPDGAGDVGGEAARALEDFAREVDNLREDPEPDQRVVGQLAALEWVVEHLGRALAARDDRAALAKLVTEVNQVIDDMESPDIEDVRDARLVASWRMDLIGAVEECDAPAPSDEQADGHDCGAVGPDGKACRGCTPGEPTNGVEQADADHD